ncbi:MAG: C40 family peptidase [Rhodocyclales bacterium]|nr:C40 family peptidase [Rhodocyclales bacterium]
MIVRLMLILTVVLLAGCGSAPTVPEKSDVAVRHPERSGGAEEVVLFSLGLLETKYRFGGRNPDAGFDCSGMVSYVFDRAVGIRLTGSAADMAKRGRRVAADEMKPGDLVFFNTLRRPRSHVGIYLGDGRFIHAPSSRGAARVRTDSLADGYFAARFEEARSYFD